MPGGADAAGAAASTPGATAETGMGAAASAEVPSDQVRVRTGRLSDTELAAVTVALAAINAASHVAADDRELLMGHGHASNAWSDPIYLVRGGQRLRGWPSDHAWVTSYR